VKPLHMLHVAQLHFHKVLFEFFFGMSLSTIGSLYEIYCSRYLNILTVCTKHQTNVGKYAIPKVSCGRELGPFISGKSRLVKYYKLARYMDPC